MTNEDIMQQQELNGNVVKKIPKAVLMRKNIEKGLWHNVSEEDVKKCPTILHHALLRYWDNTVFENLLKRGASVNERNHVNMTPLQFALNYKHNAELIKILLNYGASVKATSLCGRTPLHIAIVNNYNIDVIEKLLQCGASVNAEDNFGVNALHLALTNQHCNVAIVKKLLQRGAKFKSVPNHFHYDHYVTSTTPCPSMNPLILAAQSNQNKAIKILIKHNASAEKSLQRILLGLSRTKLHKLPYCIKLLTQYAAIEYFVSNISDEKFLQMFEEVKNIDYLNFAKSCVSELLHMKEIFVGVAKNTTLYEFLVTKEDQLVSAREDKNIINNVFTLLTIEKFPVYHNRILSQLGRNGLENILLDTVVSHKTKLLLCYDSWLLICKHLSKMDLLNLIIALRI